jgi:outer membrane protein OmpA-like peptidoglycan-associated protein
MLSNIADNIMMVLGASSNFIINSAKAVLAAIPEFGVGAQIVSAESYGSEFAKYPASAPEEDRLKDRRVSVSLREK